MKWNAKVQVGNKKCSGWLTGGQEFSPNAKIIKRKKSGAKKEKTACGRENEGGGEGEGEWEGEKGDTRGDSQLNQ